MSTLNVSNITDGTTTVGTSYVVNGSAKAWVNFNGTGTIAARDSFNVSSLTDNGGGNYTSNFTSAFSAGDYSTTLSANRGNGNTTLFNGCRIADYLAAPSGSAFRFAHGVVNASRDFQLEDASYMSMTAHGDLA